MNAQIKEDYWQRSELELFVYNRIDKDNLDEKTFDEWRGKLSGWDFIPLRNPDNVLVAVIAKIRNEIHVTIDQNYKGKWLSKWALRDIGGQILKEYGSIRTCITAEDEQAKHFVERLGFEVVPTDIINYVFTGEISDSYNKKDKKQHIRNVNADKLKTISNEIDALDGDIIEKLYNVEEWLKQLPQIALNKKHYFSKGLYAREITIPKDTLLIGKMHRFSQINTVSKGDISVLTENGWKRMKAPFTFESPPGIKRAGYTHEDTVWTTYIGTEEREQDMDKMDDLLTIGSYQQYLKVKDSLLTGE